MVRTHSKLAASPERQGQCGYVYHKPCVHTANWGKTFKPEQQSMHRPPSFCPTRSCTWVRQCWTSRSMRCPTRQGHPPVRLYISTGGHLHGYVAVEAPRSRSWRHWEGSVSGAQGPGSACPPVDLLGPTKPALCLATKKDLQGYLDLLSSLM